MKMNTFVTLLILQALYRNIRNDGIFFFDLISYHNEDNLDMYGNYCDRINQCDFYSEVVITANNTTQTWNNRNETLVWDQSVLIEDRDFIYNMTMETKPDVINVFVYIYDYDVITDDDLIDIVGITYFNNSYSETWHTAHMTNVDEKIYIIYKAYYLELKENENKTSSFINAEKINFNNNNFYSTNTINNTRVEPLDLLDDVKSMKVEFSTPNNEFNDTFHAKMLPQAKLFNASNTNGAAISPDMKINKIKLFVSSKQTVYENVDNIEKDNTTVTIQSKNVTINKDDTIKNQKLVKDNVNKVFNIDKTNESVILPRDNSTRNNLFNESNSKPNEPQSDVDISEYEVKPITLILAKKNKTVNAHHVSNLINHELHQNSNLTNSGLPLIHVNRRMAMIEIIVIPISLMLFILGIVIYYRIKEHLKKLPNSTCNVTNEDNTGNFHICETVNQSIMSDCCYENPNYANPTDLLAV
ncbi:hypothetical protein A3Q56_00121 [Intoshia linei]|uniref:Uncharacterized protein n=1 Tax=Intoshia linei TaxID=1819745 RepID=A0A177BCQ0_9BILA|nr:hypothetical protein A3Q56_00121 [Intoshia linei]